MTHAVSSATQLVAIAFLLAACALSPASTPEPFPSLLATPTAQPTPSVTPTPSPAPTPTAPPTASASEEEASVDELVMHVAPWSDIITPYTTSLMADGRLTTIRVGGGPDALTQRRLTAGGVDLIRREILDTGLFGQSAFLPPVPKPGQELPGRGTVGYIVEAVLSGQLVEVGWVSVSEDEVEWAEPSPDRERLDELGRRLTTLDEWLPPHAWADSSPLPYVPDRYRLFVTSQPWGGDLNDLPPEVDAVQWPLDGTLLTYGDPNSDASGDYTVRCAVVSAADAELVRGSMIAAGVPIGELATAKATGAGLGDRSSARIVEVLLEALHPHETSCGVNAWPPSFY